jgi:carboxypeptidase C (cathepsin A)
MTRPRFARIIGAFLTAGLVCPLPGEPKAADAEKAEAKPDVETPPSVTAHTITVDGKVLKYHATTGYLVLKEEEGKPPVPPTQNGSDPSPEQSGPAEGKEEAGKSKDGLKPKAKVFFVAYTLDDVADTSKRPVTYLFNGGPGAASIWLHLGSVAPRRAVLTDDGEAPPPPYQLADNESTWLDRTDLVFIDPVSTGYSRPMPKESAKQFHGLKEDIASVGDFIRLYTSRNARWLSPKFIVGESYGTTRAAGLSDYLQSRYGFYVNGIILVSSVLNFKTNFFTPQNDEPYVSFLPSYATAAWYHHKLSPAMQAKSVADVAQEARNFAANEYAMALQQGDAVSAQDRQHIAEELSRFTGIPANEFKLLRLRMTDGMFFQRLLLAEGRYVGRYDARFTGPSYIPGNIRDWEQYDPSFEAVEPVFNAVFNDYVRRELRFESDLPYEGLTDVQPWSYGDAANGPPNTADDLRKAMTRNPYLKVWIACSYYDLATPFLGAERVVAGMNLDPSVRPNLRFTYYESGHMLYIHARSRAKFKADFLAFLSDATSQAVVHSAAP